MRYVIYARKSTEDEDRQILSIEAQLVELKEFAAKEKLEIVASFQEAKTAKEPGRMKFAEMLSFLERGKAEGIICWHPDRLARNSVDGGKIIHFVDKGYIKALKFPTFWFEPTPQGLFMLSIAFGQSKYFVDSLRENVKRGLRQKVRRGEWPHQAPLGYFNDRNTRKLVVDKEKAPYVRKSFETYSTGKYTLLQILNFLRENDIRSNTDRPISISMVQNMLTNHLYYGAMIYKSEYHLATHKPLISKKLFDKCQEVMSKRGKQKEIRKHHFAFLGLLKCGSCDCSITAEKQKGHNYYRCTKKKELCQEKHYLREENLVEQIKMFLQKVSLSSRDTKRVLAELEKDEVQEKEKSAGLVQNLKNEISEVETKLEKLLHCELRNFKYSKKYRTLTHAVKP